MHAYISSPDTTRLCRWVLMTRTIGNFIPFVQIMHANLTKIFTERFFGSATLKIEDYSIFPLVWRNVEIPNTRGIGSALNF